MREATETMQDEAQPEMTQMYGLRQCVVYFRIDAHCEKCAANDQYTVMVVQGSIYFYHKKRVSFGKVTIFSPLSFILPTT